MDNALKHDIRAGLLAPSLLLEMMQPPADKQNIAIEKHVNRHGALGDWLIAVREKGRAENLYESRL